MTIVSRSPSDIPVLPIGEPGLASKNQWYRRALGAARSTRAPRRVSEDGNADPGRVWLVDYGYRDPRACMIVVTTDRTPFLELVNLASGWLLQGDDSEDWLSWHYLSIPHAETKIKNDSGACAPDGCTDPVHQADLADHAQNRRLSMDDLSSGMSGVVLPHERVHDVPYGRPLLWNVTQNYASGIMRPVGSLSERELRGARLVSGHLWQETCGVVI